MTLNHTPKGYGYLFTHKIGKRHWLVLEDWLTPYGIVSANFITDGATIPRVLWPFATPGGELFEAAVVHDYFYEHRIATKAEADRAFYRTARAFGVTRWKARIAYRAVKYLGRGAY